MTRHRAPEAGFSLIEVLVATSLMLLVTAGLFDIMNPAQGTYTTELEIADMQQRLRVGADTLSKALIMAGAGAYHGTQTGSLNYFFPTVLPFRLGVRSDAAPGTFTTDTVTLIYVSSTTAQTTIPAAIRGATVDLTLTSQIDCPRDPISGLVQRLCGFTKDMTVLVYDESGTYNLFTIAAVAGDTATMTMKKRAGSLATTFPAGSKIVEAQNHTYYLKTDALNNVHQLMHYDGTTNADAPVVDNIVGLRFDYYGDPDPPKVRKALSDTAPPLTTYGPRPAAVAVPPFPARENCLFFDDGSPAFGSKIGPLGDGAPALVKLADAQLTDGPFCPNDTDPNRWDADLLRIRRIAVTLRVQTALAALRGPAGALFTRAGTSRGGNKWVPDQELHFDIAPRNLNLAR
jgi:hypothetical protein